MVLSLARGGISGGPWGRGLDQRCFAWTARSNLELGHHPFTKDKTYEEQLGRQGMKKNGKSKWNRYLAEALQNLERLFNYDSLYIGGGETKHIQISLPKNAQIVSNQTGILGGIALWRD
ncbi:MAG: hypothetical protein HC792_06200 [Acaryochloridaceae cyanobacterium CSU_5_19]|nr:hypothetical protein [Acaryochloridaceae cyanobacterium CSU_5_19]